MKLIEFVDLTHKPFILNYKHQSSGEEWEKFHAHQGIEFLFIHEGTGSIVLDQKILPVTSNCLILFQPFQLHRIKINSMMKNYGRTVLNVDPHFVETYLKPFPKLIEFFHLIWKGKLQHQIFYLEKSSEYSLLYERFNTRIVNTTLEEQKEEFLLFMISFLQLLRVDTNISFKNNIESRTIHHSEKIMQWVEKHFREEFSLEKLAKDIHLSSYHVSHLFKDETGSSIIQYIIARRLREACQLLSTSDLPIAHICNQVGINNTSYFSQLFKKNIGMSPKDYRQFVQNNFNKNDKFN